MSCVSSLFINCASPISTGISDNEVTNELSYESAWELSNDWDSWSRSVRRSSAESIGESLGDCNNRLTAVSNGVSFGNWTTVSLLCIDQCSLTIPVWKSGKSGHSKDLTKRQVGGWRHEARVHWRWGGETGVSALTMIVGMVSSISSVSLRSVYLPTAAEGTTKEQINKNAIIRSFNSFDNFGAHCIDPNKNSTQNKTK